MIVKTIKIHKIVAGGPTIFELLDKYLTALEEGSVVAIASKIVAICEGNVVAIGSIDKEELIKKESEHYLPGSLSKYGISFSITKNTLIPMAGIDESNGNGNYILWPKEPQQSANEIRQYLAKRFGLKKVGVIITDSSVMPLRYGTVGIVVAHSGFLAANDYRGKPDLFGRPFKVSISSVAGGLAAAAALQMGEGAEQTPIAVIEDLPFVQFQSRDPNKKELAAFYISICGDDLFAPFLQNAPWQKGKRLSTKE
ncbi:coenzyme F420-0:L-glutamate ligase [Candidatus Saccharibacteria bacterium]|nr:coenzyme F420-0:L-glutamate ligase [Candidatus Saccharibacteria bacterium]